ncbi:MAG: formyltransferase family protein [Rhodospirillaceae bacterium]
MSDIALKTIILLTGEAEADALSRFLKAENQALNIVSAPTRAHLDTICENIGRGTRLISFCSPVIVPADYLRKIDCGSYNFHPGPPSYPGRYPSVFALYDEVETFGITVHEMVERVDEGAIIEARWFPIPPNCDLETLDTLAFQELIDTFRKMAHRLKTDLPRLRTKPIGWSGIKRSKADCDSLCRLGPNLSDSERAKRRRICGPHLTGDS